MKFHVDCKNGRHIISFLPLLKNYETWTCAGLAFISDSYTYTLGVKTLHDPFSNIILYRITVHEVGIYR